MAGSGQFPFLVAKNAKKMDLSVVACGFENNTDPALANECDAFVMLGLGQLGTLIDFFKQHGVKQACMAGAISKPKALDFKPDVRAAKLLFKLMGSRGDDAILRAIADELHTEGIEVVTPDILVPSLADTKSGVLGGPQPSAEVWRDIHFGWKMAKSLGALDIGQSIAVRDRVVVAVEGIEGTDAMLERAGSLVSGGLTVIKVLKPGQDERVDKPSVGAKTIEIMTRCGFVCLAFEAGKTLFFDQEAAIAEAAKRGISIVGVPDDADAFFKDKI